LFAVGETTDNRREDGDEDGDGGRDSYTTETTRAHCSESTSIPSICYEHCGRVLWRKNPERCHSFFYDYPYLHGHSGIVIIIISVAYN